MKIIIPMAGRGTRLRPHTLTTPKPLFEINGKTIVERLIDGLVVSFDQSVDEIAYIIGDFGDEVEKRLLQVAESKGAKGKIYYQNEPLGTAHAVYCAAESLEGAAVVAFADTLFYSDFKIDSESESVIWTQKVSNPEQFGVVITDDNNLVKDFTEKPKEFVSDQAIIGIYYFRQAERLRLALKRLIDNERTVSGEYQLTDALQDMKENGIPFLTENVSQWLDCGNSAAVLNTAKSIFQKEGHFVSTQIDSQNTVFIPPCHIADGAKISNSVIGPFVSVGKNARIINTVIADSIIGDETRIENLTAQKSVIADHAELIQSLKHYDIGSYSKLS